MKKRMCSIAACIFAVNLLSFCLPLTALGEAEAGDALKEAFAVHDEIADDLTDFNGKAEQRNRSAWDSNLTADEEQSVIDSMNGSFKDAVLAEKYRYLENPSYWDYESMLLAVLVEDEVFPKEEMDAYLL